MADNKYITLNMQMLPEYSAKTPAWKVQLDLHNVRYGFYVRWNTQFESWIMAILDSADNVIVAGVRLSIGSDDLLEKYRASCPSLPPGKLFVGDLMNDPKTAEIGRDNFSDRYRLCYMEAVDQDGNLVEV
jgi:hypothetical protein